MPKKVKPSVTRFVRLPLAYRLQLSVFHVFRASLGKCEACARTMTQSCWGGGGGGGGGGVAWAWSMTKSCSSPPPPPRVHLALAQFSGKEF